MRILVLGAGGIGGYYGARMHAAGGNVTFLVRPGRAAQLREKGLQVFSPFGDLQITPQLVTKETLTETFDVILLTCKAFDLDSAMDDIAPAVGPQTLLLPLLNGVSHLERLVARFGRERVLGGVADQRQARTHEQEVDVGVRQRRLGLLGGVAAAADERPLPHQLAGAGRVGLVVGKHEQVG